MDFQDVVRRRRMIRNFADRPVPTEILDRILRNALHAPSAGFSQGWAFLVLQGRDETERFWRTTFEEETREGFSHQGLFAAPVIIVPLSHKQGYLDRYAEPDKGWTDRDEKRWPSPFWDIDTGFASLLMLLTVVDAGLGALFFGVFAVEAFRAAFGVPAEYHPIGAIALGYRAPDTPSRSLLRGRRGLDQVVHRGRW
jgi:nitroreductase